MVRITWSAEKSPMDNSKGKIKNWSPVNDTEFFYEWQHDNLDRVSVVVAEDKYDEEKYTTLVLVDGKEERKIYTSNLRDDLSAYNRDDVRLATVQWMKSNPLVMDENGVWYEQDMSTKTSNLPTWRNPITGTKVRKKGDTFYLDTSVSEPGGLFDPELEGREARSEESRNEWMRNNTFT